MEPNLSSLDTQSFCGEAPVWHPEKKRYFWVDTGNPECYSFKPGDEKHSTLKTVGHFQALGLREKGGFIAPLLEGIVLADENLSIIEELGNPIKDRPHLCIGDGTVGPDGCYYFGYLNMEVYDSKEGGIYRVNKDLSVEKVLGNLALPNGLAFSPDGSIFYVTEMFAHRILAYRFDAKTGNISGEKELIRIPEEKGLPDGLICDRDGCLWSAHWQGFRLTRYRPDGAIDREIPIPVPTPTCMGFGGPSLSTLLITTARKGLSEQQLADYPESGYTILMETEFTGIAERRFAG